MNKYWFLKGCGAIGILFILSLNFSSCEEANQLTGVNFDTDLVFTVPVAELNNGSDISYSTSLLLDAATNPDIKKYANKIRSIEVLMMEFAIEDYTTIINDEIYLKNGSFGLSDQSSTKAQASCNVDALPITHWAGTGYFKVDSCNSTLNSIGSYLTKDQMVKIYVDGILTKAPVSFNLKVHMKVRVVADAL